MPTPTQSAVIAHLAKRAPRNVFADVTSVDDCGAPILPDGMLPVPCENDYAQIVDGSGPMTRMRVTTAEREVAAGRLTWVHGNVYRACNRQLDAAAADMLARAQAAREAKAAARRERYQAETRSWATV